MKHIYPLCRHKARLSRAEYESIKNTRFFDVIMELVLNMLAGDGEFTPDTPMYKFVMSLCGVLDSIIEAQPFYDLEGKVLKGYTVSEIIEPMLFNNYIPDGNAEFVFSRLPEARFNTAPVKDCSGDVIMLLLSILVLPVAKLLPVFGSVALPAAVLIKKRSRKKKPLRPERY